MPQPPPFGLERRERALHLVLRAGADSAATGERKPVTSVVDQPDRAEEQQPGERRRSRAQDHEPEQRDDDAAQGRFAGVRRAGDTADGARSSRRDRLELTAAAGRAPARPELCHRSILSPAPDAPDRADHRPEIRPVLGGHGRRMFLQPAPKPAPKAPFRSLKSATLQGESGYRYRDSNLVVERPLRAIRVTSLSTFMSICCPER